MLAFRVFICLTRATISLARSLARLARYHLSTTKDDEGANCPFCRDLPLPSSSFSLLAANDTTATTALIFHKSSIIVRSLILGRTKCTEICLTNFTTAVSNCRSSVNLVSLHYMNKTKRYLTPRRPTPGSKYHRRRRPLPRIFFFFPSLFSVLLSSGTIHKCCPQSFRVFGPPLHSIKSTQPP